MRNFIKKIPALLLAAVMALTVLPAAALAASGTITENGTYDLSAYGNNSTITINSGITVTLAGSAEAPVYTNVKIVCGAGVSLTLNNVNIDNNTVSGACALSFTGAGNALTLVGESTLSSAESQPGVRVESGTELIIDGGDTDELTVTGGKYAAGIGGGDADFGTADSGSITINGGTVIASTAGGAGIGGGYSGNGGSVIINGGAVTANSTLTGGAGIGGGYSGNGGSVTISGGTVVAKGGIQGAGIGGGYSGDGGSVTVSGGMVTATGGKYAAGIGGGGGSGNGGFGGTITVSGGTVTAIGGNNGAGIGGGGTNSSSVSYFGGSGGNVTITGGTVTATGGSNGAGIGGGGRSNGGNGGNGGTVSISGGTVKATGSGGGADIGGSLNATNQGSLENGKGDAVYLTTLRLLGSGAGNAAVSSLTTDLAYEYGVNDLFTSGSGWLYLYLPLGTATTRVVTSAGAYTGGAITANSPTESYFSEGGDAREIELRNNGTTIQWRYEGETQWHDLVALSVLTGATGADGREIELRVDGGYIQWHYTGDTSWNNIVALSAITGPQGPAGENGADGREIELRNSGAAIQWRYVGETTWNDLVTLAALTGADGVDGREIELRVDGGYIQWRYAGENWSNLMAVSVVEGPQGAAGANGRDGRDGVDGREIELRNNGTAIQWRYAGETAWRDLVTLAALTGAAGADGRNGKDGQTGKDGKDGKDGVGVASIILNESGELVFTFTDGTQSNLGPLPSDSVQVIATVPAENGGTSAAFPIALGAAALLSHLGWLIPLLRRKKAKR